MISDSDFTAYLAGRLTAEERQRIEQALAEDRDLRRALWTQMRLDAALQVLHGSRGDAVRSAVLAALAIPPAPKAVVEKAPEPHARRPLHKYPLAWLIALALMLSTLFLGQTLLLRLSPRPSRPFGAIVFAKGDCALHRAGDSSAPRAGIGLSAGDSLESGEDGAIVARMGGASLALASSTGVVLEHLDPDAVTLTLRAGTLSIEASGHGTIVKTAHAVTAGTGDTSFTLSGDDRRTRLDVSSGVVEFSLPDTSRSLRVEPSRSAIATGEALTLLPKHAAPRKSR